MQDQDRPFGKEIKYFVRIRGRRHDFVEFDFAIGSPDLAVELMMPQRKFDEFCSRYEAIRLDHADSDAIDVERAQWRHGTMDLNDHR